MAHFLGLVVFVDVVHYTNMGYLDFLISCIPLGFYCHKAHSSVGGFLLTAGSLMESGCLYAIGFNYTDFGCQLHYGSLSCRGCLTNSGQLMFIGCISSTGSLVHNGFLKTNGSLIFSGCLLHFGSLASVGCLGKSGSLCRVGCLMIHGQRSLIVFT